MSTVKSKTVKKRIRTTLKVKLMEGKTFRDMYRDFFRGNAPKGFEEKVTRTVVSLDKETVSYDLYKKFSGFGANREFLESFVFQYISEYKQVDQSSLAEAMYKVVPFMTLSGISSIIMSYTLGTNRLDSDYLRELELEIETFSYRDNITAEQIKAVNKENARKLKYYLVSLPSVQGVPYSCSYKEDEILEETCSV